MSATPITGGTVTLTTDATVGSGESAELVVGVDEGNTGTVDRTRTISVPDGVHEVELDDWPANSGDRYLWTVDLDAQTAEQSPQIHSVEITSTGAEPIGAVYAPVVLDGTTHSFEVPVFNPDTIADSRLRVRLPDGREGALYLVDAGTSPLECRTPDSVRHGVYISEGDYEPGPGTGSQSLPFGEGAYGAGPYGEGGTSYSPKEPLTIPSGETHIVSSGDSESYTETSIEESGTLNQEDGSELHTTGE